MKKSEIEFLKLLAHRLERLNVDSLWARRASGTRGNIIKILAEVEEGQKVDSERLSPLIDRAFDVLTHAAQEIPDMDEIKRRYESHES